MDRAVANRYSWALLTIAVPYFFASNVCLCCAATRLFMHPAAAHDPCMSGGAN